MLVLSRKTDEQIVIGDAIRITVLRVKGDKVKLGIQAGDDLKILRGELLVSEDNPVAESSSASPNTVTDPTAGFSEDDKDDAKSHLAGVSDGNSGSAWKDSRPAWLSICCCS